MDAIDEGGMARQHMEAQASLLPPPAQVIEQFGVLPSTFATERRHKVYKQFSGGLSQPSDQFEFSVMVSLVADHFQTLQEEEGPCNPEKLLGGQKAGEPFRRMLQLPVQEVSMSAKVAGK